jgi:hypothetical protein
MVKWYYRFIDGTRIKFDMKHPPFRLSEWRLIKRLKVDFVATIVTNGEKK